MTTADAAGVRPGPRLNIIQAPEDAAGKVRRAVGLAPGEPLRLSYLAGPGDVVGSFEHWRAGAHDPRVPNAAYSPQFYDLAALLDAEAQVFTTRDPPGEPDPRSRFETVTRSQGRGALGYWYGEWRYLREISRRVESFAPHVVIANTDTGFLAWPMLGRGRRLVLSAHNTFWTRDRPPSGLKGALKLRLMRRCARPLDGAVCVSEECCRQVALVTDGRLAPHLQRTQMIARYALQRRERLRRALYLGRIERGKGVFLLLEAFEALRRRFDGLELVVAGDGGASEEFARRAAAVEGVRFVGRLPSAGVHEAIAATDLLVCPTTSSFPEGMAVVGLEAAAHGIPSAVSDAVPAAEFLGDACTVFAADSARAIEDAIAGLVRDEAAYAALCRGAASKREALYDRSLSWASRMLTALLALEAAPSAERFGTGRGTEVGLSTKSA